MNEIEKELEVLISRKRDLQSSLEPTDSPGLMDHELRMAPQHSQEPCNDKQLLMGKVSHLEFICNSPQDTEVELRKTMAYLEAENKMLHEELHHIRKELEKKSSRKQDKT
jgi:hypothetical protein